MTGELIIMAQAPQVDPNVQAILGQHQQQLQAFQQAQQQEQQRHQRQDNIRSKDRWISRQKAKMEKCDGGGLRNVRKWIRHIHKASGRLPANVNNDSYMCTLMSDTSTEDLAEALDTINAANVGNPLPWAQVLAQINAEFLGPDEANSLKEDLRSMRQSAREDVPGYNRRFSKLADYAYPLPRAPDTEELVTDWYLGSLMAGKVRDRAFAHDPALVTLAAAMQVTSEEFARQRRQRRVTRHVPRCEEPMEVDVLSDSDDDEPSQAVGTKTTAAVGTKTAAPAIQPTTREQMAALASAIRTMQQDFKNLQIQTKTPIAAPAAPAPAPAPQAPADKRTMRCFYCHNLGHMRRECRKRARDVARRQQPQGNFQ